MASPELWAVETSSSPNCTHSRTPKVVIVEPTMAQQCVIDCKVLTGGSQPITKSWMIAHLRVLGQRAAKKGQYPLEDPNHSKSGSGIKLCFGWESHREALPSSWLHGRGRGLPPREATADHSMMIRLTSCSPIDSAASTCRRLTAHKPWSFYSCRERNSSINYCIGKLKEIQNPTL